MSKLINAGLQQGTYKIANKKLRTLLATTAMTAAGMLALGAAPAFAVDDFATPTGEVVVGGSASFDRPADGMLNVLQNTQRVVINWNSFNVGSKAKTEFFQPNSSALAVNRVVGNNADPTQILGSLKANGRLMVIDRSGVFFGQDSRVDVGGIIVSTGDVDTDAVMSGADRLELSNFGNGSVVNYGTINVADAGLAAFVSPSVVNYGVINAKLGKVALGAGSKVTLDLYGDDLIEIALDDKLADALIENTGAINAEGGSVLVSVATAKAAVDNVINMGGVVDVSSVEVKAGKIVLLGGDEGVTNVTGTLNAAGDGGFVETSGANVNVTADASITADMWLIDPLTIRISNTVNSNYTTINATVLSTSLNTGSVTLQTGVNSSSTASGDNNGDILIHDTINKTGAANTTLSLIATRDITFTGGSGINSSGGALNLAFGAGRDVNLNRTITNNGGNVTMTAVGDVLLDSSMNTGGGNVLFTAGDDVTIDATLNSGVGSVTLNASDDINVKKKIETAGGTVTATAGDDLTLDDEIYTNGGAASFSAGGDFVLDDSDDLVSTLGSDAPITILASTFDLGGYLFAGTNTITIGRSTVGTIDMGDANGSAFRIDQSEINRMFAGNFVIGNANTTNVTVDNVEMFAQFKQDEDELPTPSQGCENQSGGNPNCSSNFEMRDTNLTLKSTSFVDIIGEGLTMGTGWVKVDAPRLDLNSRVYGKNTLAGSAFELGDDRLLGTEQLVLINVISPNAKIKQAHDFADSSATKTIDVGAGTYNENVLIYKNKINLLGNNAGIDPNTGVRVAESIINGGIGLDGTAFAVKTTADDFTIDGFKLTADGNGVDLDGTDGSISNQIVRNNIITTQNIVDSDDEGIEGTNVNNGLIENNKLNVVGNDGMKFTGGSNITIEENTVTGTDLKGLNLNNIAGLTVQLNKINNTGDDGMEINNSSGVTVFGNLIGTLGGANNIEGEGIDVNNSPSTVIMSNTVWNTTGNGISLNPSSGSEIRNNLLQNVGGDGIHTEGSSNLWIGGNNLYTITGDGIKVIGGDHNHIGVNNTVQYTGGDGIEVQDSDYAYVDYNYVAHTGANGIYNNSSDGSTVTHNTVENTTGHGVKVNPSLGVTVSYNVINNAAVDGANVSNSDGSHVSYNTITNSGDNGVELNNSDDSFVNGNTINGTVYGYDSNGIFVIDSLNGTIDHNLVNNAQWDGIKLVNSDGTDVAYNTVNNALLSGIALFDSDDSSVSDNTVNNSGTEGIHSGNNDRLTVSNNTVNTTGLNGGFEGHGIWHHSSDDATITGNTVNDAEVDGIAVWGLGGTNLIGNNDVFSAGRDGIAAYYSTGVTISNNDDTVGTGVNGSGNNGIGVYGSHGTIVSSNDVDDSGWDGINVSNSNGVQVTGNSITDTIGASGIAILGSLNNYVGGNYVARSARLGIYALDANGLTVFNNGVYNSGLGADQWSGIHIESTDGVSITLNTVGGADWDGINIGGNINTLDGTSSNVTVDGNLVYSVTRDGIHATAGVLSASGNTVDITGDEGIEINNSADVAVNNNFVGTFGGANNIGGNGIEVNNSSSADIMGNTVANTVGAGIFVDPSPFTLISGNSVSGFGTYGIQLLDSDDSSIVGNTVTGNSDSQTGVYVSNSDRVTIGDGWTDGDSDRNTVSNVGTGVYVVDSDDATVDNNRIYNVDNGIYASNTDGLNVEDNDITGGHCGWGDGTGIDVRDSANVRIGGAHDGNNVDSFWRGIASYSNDGVTIANNTVWNIDDNGIHVSGGNNALIDSNVVDDTGNDGIYVDYMGEENWSEVEGEDEESVLLPNVVISNNDVGTSYYGYIGGDGIEVYNVVSSLIESNDVGNFGYYGYSVGGDGILVTNEEEYDPTVIQYNTVLNVAGNGIHVAGLDEATIFDNTVDTTGNHGILATDIDTLFIDYNDVSNAGHSEYYSWGGSWAYYDYYYGGYYYTGEYTYSGYNGVGDGIHVENSDGAQITNNTVTNTALNGVYLADSEGSLIAGNDVTDAGGDYSQYYDEWYYWYGWYNSWNSSWTDAQGDGIHVENSDNTVIGGSGEGELNTVSHSARNGIFVQDSDYIVVDSNDVNESGANGIYVDPSDYVSITGNIVNDSGENGIYLDYGIEGFIGGNTVDDSNYDGIRVSQNHGVEINDNTVTDSGDDGIDVYDSIYGGYYSGYTVEILNNTVEDSGDNGIEVEMRRYNGADGDLLIQGNDVHGDGEGYEYNNDSAGIFVELYSGQNGEGYEYYDYSLGEWVYVENPSDINALIDDNTVDGHLNGIVVLSDVGDNNECDGECYDDYGYGTHTITISNNELDGAYDYYDYGYYSDYGYWNTPYQGTGILVMEDNWINVEGEGYYGYTEVRGPHDGFTDVTIDHNTVNDYLTTGIRTESVDVANILFNDVTNSGQFGYMASGPFNGDVVLAGNNFNDNPVGALFNSGLIDLTGETNTFNGGEIGMLFDPLNTFYRGRRGEQEISFFEDGPYYGGGDYPVYSTYGDLNLVDDTIGTTVFNDQSGYYVYLEDFALWAPGFPTVIDGTDATYDGVHPQSTGNVLTLGQYNQIEAMIHDYLDEDERGLFFIGGVQQDQEIDQAHIFNTFDYFTNYGPGLRITITGLPGLPGEGGSFFASISPAAGDEEGEGGQGADDLAKIEPAAGGNEESCWADAVNAAQSGATANYTYTGTLEDLLADNADCQSGKI